MLLCFPPVAAILTDNTLCCRLREFVFGLSQFYVHGYFCGLEGDPEVQLLGAGGERHMSGRQMVL